MNRRGFLRFLAVGALAAHAKLGNLIPVVPEAVESEAETMTVWNTDPFIEGDRIRMGDSKEVLRIIGIDRSRGTITVERGR